MFWSFLDLIRDRAEAAVHIRPDRPDHTQEIDEIVEVSKLFINILFDHFYHES